MDFAQIHLLDAPFSVDRPYTYAIPPHLAEQVRAGRLVTVPFGRGSHPAPGVVTALCDTCDYPQVKSVLSVSDDLFSLTPPMLALALYLCESTLCTVGEAVHALLPPGAIAQKASAKTERNVCSLLSPEEITSVLGGSVKLRSEAHRTVLSFFLEHAGTVPLKELCLRLSVSTAQVTALVERYYPLFAARGVPYPKAIRVKCIKSRFGSCAPATGSLNFAARLCEYPIPFVEYVVVHELCHFLEANHSAHFWREVERVLPDYREREKLGKVDG